MKTLGWREYVDLPELGIYQLKAKIDTGAQSSSLHVSAVTVLDHDVGGREYIELTVPLASHDAPTLIARAWVSRYTWVKNTGGVRQKRRVIETLLCLGGECIVMPLTLSDRSAMSHRMILGRTALAGHFLVDVSCEFLISPIPVPNS
ncbi:RimK/LysX family protein [Leptolyngbya sp. FACHB-261]|uniref:ATP-dependent zinc protease family protein n=1 Tax=Leptolyngbya sp. FACHB-261 TaxID=2692806 RepID=UPI001688E9C2|nr:RimK/LysX family protein [Leptolyngbya sp. FACHB-261]MBD2100711.1 ATP-dependent zinc protease [Leptolyngbya sp. FACHB-261]